MQVAEKHHTDRNHAAAWFSAAAWPALLLAIYICFFWKLVLTNQYTWLESPDTANQILPWMQFQAGEWHQGRFPLWDPYLWGGQPLAAQAQPGAFYPPNWLLFLCAASEWLDPAVRFALVFRAHPLSGRPVLLLALPRPEAFAGGFDDLGPGLRDGWIRRDQQLAADA